MTKLVNYFICLSATSLFAACDWHMAFGVINYTDEPQIVYVTGDDSLMIHSGGDSIATLQFKWFDNNKSKAREMGYYVRGKSHILYGFSIAGKETFGSKYKGGYIRIYFISDSVFMRNPWATIVKHQMYNKKLTYTYEQIDSLGWVIEYK